MRYSHFFINPPIIIISSLLLSVTLNIYCPTYFLFPKQYNFIGIILIFISLISIIYCFIQFLKFHTTPIYGKKSNKLITDGLYAYSRNPLYLSWIIFLLGVDIILGNLSTFIGLLFFIIFTNFLIVPTEEKMLEKIFSEKYFNYKKQVPRWI